MAADASMVHFGAQSLLHELHAMVKEADGGRLAEDLEFVHRMRVASRRLRQRLALFAAILPERKSEAWVKEVKRLTRALGAARDRDVQIELLEKLEAELADAGKKPGYERLLLRMRQRRAKEQKKVIHALDRAETGGELAEMERTFRQLRVAGEMRPESARPTAALFAMARAAVAAGLEQLLAYEIYLSQPERGVELHEMRIAAKQFRYTLEAFAPLFPDELKAEMKAMKSVQDHLGDIHDCDVWIGALPGFVEEEKERAIDYLGHARGISRLKPGIAHLIENRRAVRERNVADLQKLWAQLKKDGMWPRLLAAMEQAEADALVAPAPPAELPI